MAPELMDELDDSARQWGAVNTVCFEGTDDGGDWKPLREFSEAPPGQVRSKGYNTDADGLLTALKEDLGMYLEGARVMVLGAGGVGRVAALLLAREQVSDLFLVNRTASKAGELAAEIKERFPSIHVMAGYPHREVDLVINATSLGLAPDAPLPLDLDRFPLTDAKAVYDMIYRPAETRLLDTARESGARAVNGLGMLLYQGVAAFEIWTGQAAPVDIMRNAIEKEIYGG